MPEINFTAEDWARIRRDYSLWWDGKLDRPLVSMPEVTPNGRPRELGQFRPLLSHYPGDAPPERIVRDFIEYQAQTVFAGDTYPFFNVNFGAGVLAAPLGANVEVADDTVWFSPQDGAEASSLKICFDPENHWWKRVVEVTKAASEMIGGRVQVTCTDLGGNLDVLAALVGTEKLLLATVDCPEKMDRLAAGVTRLWLAGHDELAGIVRGRCPGFQAWAPIWAPGTTYMLQSDFSYMISPAMFTRFALGDLAACCEHVEYPFYHMDGVGQLPHLEQLLSIGKLRGIQWQPGDGKPLADGWPDLLRRIRNAGKLVQVFVTADGARRICRDLGGRGFLLRVKDTMSVAAARKLLDDVKRMNG